MVLFIYRTLINIIFILSPIIVLIRIVKKKEDLKRFKEKFCIFSKKKIKKKLIWFHGASVGEISSIIPLVFKLEENKKIDQILITSSTLSSANVLKKFKFKKTIHQFYPIDTNHISKKFLNYWSPSLAIFIDSEIWPNMLLNLKKKSIPIFLLNARITKKSFNKWKKLGEFSKKIFQCFEKSLVSNQETVKYLKYFKVKNIKFFGNLKFVQNKNKNLSLPTKIQNIILSKKTWCASSTHEGEELICLKVHKNLKNKYKNFFSIIIPRHIDRSAEIIRMIKDENLKVHRHSCKGRVPSDLDIYLVDTYGETEKFFNLIKIVFIGGSLVNHGGQNPLESVRHGCNVLHGPNVHNFKNIYDYLDRIKLSTKVVNDKSLCKSIDKLFTSKTKTKSVVKKVKKLGDIVFFNTINEINKALAK